MGWLSTLIGGLITSSQNKKNRAWNSAEAEKNREFQSEEAEIARLFNSNEAALQREWSAAEAERARDWNEEMYAKYNSLSGKIAQAEQAGVNPMLAITGNAVSPMTASSSAPSGASASSGSPSGSTATSSFVDIVGSMLGMGKLKAEIDNIKADTKKKEEEGKGQQITNESLREMNVQQILESRSRIEFNQENTKLVTQKIVESQASVEKIGAELGQIASSIANMDVDTRVKEQQILVMISEIAKNNKSLDVMSAQISEMLSSAGLNSERVNEVRKTLELMSQQYDHNAVVNGFEQVIKALEANDANYWNSDNYSGAGALVVRLTKELRTLLTFGKK